MYQTGAEQQETLYWAVLATHLNGAADSRKYEHIDTDVIVRHIEHGDVFEFLRVELGQDVAYALGKLTIKSFKEATVNDSLDNKGGIAPSGAVS